MSTKISVNIKPGSSQEKILKNEDGSYTIYLRARAHDGEANIALVRLLSKHFDIPKTSIEIIFGHTSRRKVISLPT